MQYKQISKHKAPKNSPLGLINSFIQRFLFFCTNYYCLIVMYCLDTTTKRYLFRYIFYNKTSKISYCNYTFAIKHYRTEVIMLLTVSQIHLAGVENFRYSFKYISMLFFRCVIWSFFLSADIRVMVAEPKCVTLTFGS